MKKPKQMSKRWRRKELELKKIDNVLENLFNLGLVEKFPLTNEYKISEPVGKIRKKYKISIRTTIEFIDRACSIYVRKNETEIDFKGKIFKITEFLIEKTLGFLFFLFFPIPIKHKI